MIKFCIKFLIAFGKNLQYENGHVLTTEVESSYLFSNTLTKSALSAFNKVSKYLKYSFMTCCGTGGHKLNNKFHKVKLGDA